MNNSSSKEEQLPPRPFRNLDASPSLESLLREGLAHAPSSSLGARHSPSNVLIGCPCRACSRTPHAMSSEAEATLREFTYNVIKQALVIIDDTVLDFPYGRSTDETETTSSN